MMIGKKIIIKPLQKKHLEMLRILRNDPETNYFLTSIVPINEHMQEEWFKKISLDDSKMYLAIESKRKAFLGVVRCDQWDKINQSIRVGIDILPEFRRQGYATEAFKILLTFLFNELALNRIWLLVLDYNKRAMHLYKKLGFRIEGKQREAIFRNNKFNDYIMMSLLKKEYENQKKH